MAIVLNGSSQYGSIASAVVGAAPFTIVGWVKHGGVGALEALLGLHASASVSDTNCFYAYKSTTSAFTARTNAPQASTSTTATSSVWTLYIGEFSSASARQVWMDNAGNGTNTNSQTPAGINQMNLGRQGGSANDRYYQGKLAAWAIYNGVLTSGERAMLLTHAPNLVSSNLLLANWDLIADGSARVGPAWSFTGSPTFDTDVPPIIFSIPGEGVIPSRRERRFTGYADPRLSA